MRRFLLPSVFLLVAAALALDVESYPFGEARETNRVPTVASVEAIASALEALPLDEVAEHRHDASDVTNLAAVATSGAYADLSGRPTNVSSFTNDAGYLVGSDLPDWTKSATKPAYTASEVGAATPADLAAVALGATNYTDAAVGAISAASIGAVTSLAPATNYTDAVVGGITASSLGAVTSLAPATNYTDSVAAGITAASIGAATAADVSSAVSSITASSIGAASQADVAAAVATLGADAAATAAWRIILADHQRRLDAIEDADGTDALTEAQAEELIRSRVDTAISALENEWGDVSGCIPVQTQETVATAISANASGVSVSLSPLRATRYYSSGSSHSIGFSSFSGVGNNPCVLILDGFSAVTWPSGARVSGAYSSSSGANVYEVYRLGGVLYARRVYP